MNLSTKRFGKNLYVWRTQRRMSQAQLAEKCGLTNTHISHFECGERLPSLTNFSKLCNALNIDAQNLLCP